MELSQTVRSNIEKHTYVDPNTGCWLWGGYCDKDGYGKVSMNKAPVSVHRINYTLKYGPIPKDKILRHKCNTPQCSNPDHLLLGTQKDNIRDMVLSGRASWQGKYAENFSMNLSHCKNGHEYEVVGFYLRPGGRACKACHLQKCKEYHKKIMDIKGRKGNFRLNKTHCKYGHEYTAENIFMKIQKGKRHRVCKICQKKWKSK